MSITFSRTVIEPTLIASLSLLLIINRPISELLLKFYNLEDAEGGVDEGGVDESGWILRRGSLMAKQDVSTSQ